jgi:hypothetical protein
MERASNREKVRRKLEQLLAKDKAKTTLNRISELGLIEMTRKRTRESLGRTMNEPCFYCDGTGSSSRSTPSPTRSCGRSAASALNLPGYVVVVNAHPAVVDLLKNEERIAVQEAERASSGASSWCPARSTTSSSSTWEVGHHERRDPAHAASDPAERLRPPRRVTINKEFESYDAFISEYVTNISRKGAFVRSKTPLPVGTKVNLRFTVIMDDIETIEGVGEVVRVHDDPAGMGVVFTELSERLPGPHRQAPRDAGRSATARRIECSPASSRPWATCGKSPAAGPWRARASRRRCTPLELGESIAVDGVCLTVDRIVAGGFEADVSEETLARTTLGALPCGIERTSRARHPARRAAGGHMVLGHVDGIGAVSAVTPVGETRRLSVRASRALAALSRTKGSIAVDGVSLTVNQVRDGEGERRVRRDARPAHARAHEAAGLSARGPP